MEDIKEIFDKKSPLFIITITIFITSIVAKEQPLNQACLHSPQLSIFQNCLITITGAALFLKTVAIQIIKKCCGSSIGMLHNLIVFGLLLVDVGMYAWSLYLYISMLPLQECYENEPHHFLVQVYSALYSLLYSVVLIIIVSIKLQNKTMTVFQSNSIKEDQEL